jgi:hypothetical protein
MALYWLGSAGLLLQVSIKAGNKSHSKYRYGQLWIVRHAFICVLVLEKKLYS